MALIWLGLNGADGYSWIVGAPAVIAAAWISLGLLPTISWHWSAVGAMAFAGYFLRESFRGGWDVAKRALAPKLRLSPGIVCLRPRLPPGPARCFFYGTISLLPGTAVVAIGEDELRVHVLDLAPERAEELRTLENRVAALFRLDLAASQEVTT
jgi:multicomponent Na+:H+ antiporter subunit E